MGERQRVEILKLLQRQSRVLIFDEPTSVLTPHEIEQLFKALRNMANQGKAIVFISHKLGEVLEIADDIAILRRGEIIEEQPKAAFGARAELARRMVGRDVLLEIERPTVELRQPVLQVEQLSGAGLENISLRLKQGEILGILGVAGNGQTPLVQTLCGLRAPGSGTVRILGQDWDRFFSGSPSGLVYIPEDRLGLATCPRLNLLDNFLLTTRRRFCRGPWLRRMPATKRLDALMADFRHPACRCPAGGPPAFGRESAKARARTRILSLPTSDRCRTTDSGTGHRRHRGCLEAAAQSARRSRNCAGHRRPERGPDPL